MSPAHVEAGINIKNAVGNNPSAYKPMFRRSSQIENGHGSVQYAGGGQEISLRLNRQFYNSFSISVRFFAMLQGFFPGL